MTFPVQASAIDDPLNRANEDPLSFGGKWAGYVEVHGFTLRINSTGSGAQVHGSGSGGDAGALWIADGEMTDCDIYIRAIDITPGAITLLARAQTPFGIFEAIDGYEFEFSGGGVNIFSTTGGTRTSLASASHSISNGDYVGVSLRGSTLEAYWAHSASIPPAAGAWTLLTSTSNADFSIGYPGLKLHLLQPLVQSFSTKLANPVSLWASTFHGRDV